MLREVFSQLHFSFAETRSNAYLLSVISCSYYYPFLLLNYMCVWLFVMTKILMDFLTSMHWESRGSYEFHVLSCRRFRLI